MKPWKKYFAIFLMLLIVFALPAGAYAAEQKSFRTEDELTEYLQKQKSDKKVTVEFTCSKDLYSYLSADGFKEFLRLLYRAGINGRAAGIYYSDKTNTIKVVFSSMKEKVYECGTTADVEAALADLAKDKAEKAYLLCEPSLYKTLTANSESFLYFPAAKQGIYNMSDRSMDDYEIIELSNVDYIDGPYAYVEDNAQFAAAVDQNKTQKLDEFYIVFSYDMYKRIMNSKPEWKTMLAGSKIDTCITNGNGRSGALKFSGVEYTDIARSICRTTKELSGIISQMGASGITEFEIFFPDTKVFDELEENDFAKLHKIEAEAGLTSGSVSYSMNHDRIIYKDAKIASDAKALESLSDAVSYTEEQVAAGSTEISLFCTEKLYNDLLGDMTKQFVIIPDGMTRIYDLLSQAGICDYELASFPSTHVINVSIKKLFPGTAIMLAEKTGDDSALTDREKKTRDEAKKIAEEAKNEDPLLTAKYIHDWLCEKNTYTDDEETDEDDTAIGAVLNGEANCDGYTDAFYLIGSLAGLNVRYQHGDSYEKGFTFSITPVTHIWNLLNIDDEWRMVDVTWDDNNESPTYVWFNVGEDVASLMHFWNKDMTVSLAPDTERQYFAENEFYAKDIGEVKDILKKVNDEQPNGFLLIAPGVKEEEIVQLLRDEITAEHIRYSWNEKMNMLTVLFK